MPQSPSPTELEYLRARAAVARDLVTEREMSPESALFFAVWPTSDVVEAERRANRFTIASRAYSPRLNV